jgi:uncharacterized linocin/CFP29 family protein
MERMYRFSKKITEEQAQEILKEMKEVDDVDDVYFAPDEACLVVGTSEAKFPAVMGKAVNICSRAAGGVEISFAGFYYKTE